MIVYVASFPRSGNNWTGTLLANNFGVERAVINPNPVTLQDVTDAISLKNRGAKKSNEWVHPLLQPQFAELDPSFLYVLDADGQPQKWSVIRFEQKRIADPVYRLALAQEPTIYCIKTHYFPWAQYCPGEYVIQPIRHPGACLWSFYNFLRDINHQEQPLEDVIVGKNERNWSEYHRAWAQARQALGERYLPLYYERRFNELETCRAISRFTGLPIISYRFEHFETSKQNRPGIVRQGKIDEWREHFDRAQLELLWKMHGEMMLEHGYANPLEDQPRSQPAGAGSARAEITAAADPLLSPLFISARFRTGSTMLWNMFSQIPEVCAFYEPLHEQLFSLADARVQPEHFHVKGYYAEYRSIAGLLGTYRAEHGYNRLLLEADDRYDSLKTYLDTLIGSKAFQKVVLQCNRVDFRLDWLKQWFPQAKILHLYRDPRSQWQSSLVRFSGDVDADIDADPYRITTWSRDLCGMFPFLAAPFLRHPYQRFYYLWKLSFLAGSRQAHLSLRYEDILEHPEESIKKMLELAGLHSDENLQRCQAVLVRQPERLWRENRPESWYAELEGECEDLLERFGLNARFGLTPLREIIASCPEYQQMTAFPQVYEWSAKSSQQSIFSLLNELEAKEKMIQETAAALRAAEANARTLQLALDSQGIQKPLPVGVGSGNTEVDLANARLLLQEQMRELQAKEAVITYLKPVRTTSPVYWVRDRFLLPIRYRAAAAVNRRLEGLFEKQRRGAALPPVQRAAVNLQINLILLLKNFRRLFLPKLFVLEQHPPCALYIPEEYARTAPAPDAMPTISIVTPSFNQGSFIGQTMESVLSQGYPALQYVVQDAGSTDGTAAVLAQIHHPDLQVYVEPDHGQADGINRGFSHTSGGILAYLNSDDVLLPGALAFVGQYFHDHPAVDVIYSHRVIINEHNQEIGRWLLPEYDADLLRYADYVPQETLFWRSRAWQAAGGRIDDSFRFAMDWDLLVRFQQAGMRIVRVPRFLSAFRVHQNQKTSTIMAEIGLQEMNLVREKALGFVPTQTEIDLKFRRYLRRSVVLHRLYQLKLYRA